MNHKLVFFSIVALITLGACQEYASHKQPAIVQEEVWIPIIDENKGVIEIGKINTESNEIEILAYYPLHYPLQSLGEDELAILEHNVCFKNSVLCQNISLMFTIEALSFSPDHRQIAWKEGASWCPGTGCYGFVRIITYDPNTKLKQTLVEFPSHLDLITRQGIPSFHWSPNSQKLAFVHSTDSWSRVRIVDAASGQLMDLGEGQAPITWSPNGEQIASSSYSKFNNHEIKIMGLNGKTASVFSQNWHIIESLAWSPDGSKIAVTAWEGEGAGVPRYELYILDLAKKEVTKLPMNKGFSYTGVQWSPNGSILGVTAYSVEVSKEGNVFFVETSSGETKVKVTVECEDIKWLWSRTGNTILLKLSGLGTERIGVFNWADNELKYLTFPPQIENELKELNIWLGDPTW